jgi:hypothetical protein
LTEDGDPALSAFVNDVSPLASGQARLTVRHTAAAPEVDVLADGDALFTDLANGEEASADVAAGTYEVAVAAAGTTDPVLRPTDLELEAGTAYFVYAIGSLEDDTLGRKGICAAPDPIVRRMVKRAESCSCGRCTSW